MTVVDNFQIGMADILNYGKLVRIKYYNTNVLEDSYDDDIILTQSGSDLWTSGVILPITNTRGSNDAILLEQGKILTNDTKLYIEGSINTSGTVKIGLGSYSNMSGCEYSLLSEGITKYEVSDTDIYKKIYVRVLTNGSLMGE